MILSMGVSIREYSMKRDKFSLINAVADFFNEQRVMAGKDASFSLEDAEKSVKEDFFPSDSNAVFVAESDGRIVGFSRLKQSEGAWFLREISVLKSERGKGIGSLLFDKSVDFLKSKGEKAFYLSVIPSNESGLSFFRKKGISRLNTVELESRIDGRKFKAEKKINFSGFDFEY